MIPAGFRILYNGKPMLQAQLVIHAPNRPSRAPEVAEFFLAVQRGRIYDDVVIILMLESRCSKASEPSIQVYFNLSEPPQYIVYLCSKYTYP